MPLLKKLKSHLAIGLFFLLSNTTYAQNKIINGPAGSGQFGTNVTVLPNGNYVVTDPKFDNALTDVGAVYLYNGATHALISTLTGSSANDQIGSSGIKVLTNGNFIVGSKLWDNGSNTDAGAVTWCSGTTGRSGAVGISNSLVGAKTDDQIGTTGSIVGNSIIELKNGNYIVVSPLWDNGAILNAGAVTWCNGTSGRTGAISSGNSLVGASDDDQVGFFGNINITLLDNGSYVVVSGSWDNTVTDDGAVTWCDGTTGRAGIVSASNSLIGFGTSSISIYKLTNGHYVVGSSQASLSGTKNGCVTWCNGTTGRIGPINVSNSLTGFKSFDGVGSSVVPLTNGNYVVLSDIWDNGLITDAGAATWCDGTTGRNGGVSASNSLVGSTANDNVGRAIAILSNGNYVVESPFWNNGPIAGAGAVTWCDGSTGRVGAVSASNSLVGSSANDRIGKVTPLTNGNYVVNSPLRDNGAIVDAGAVTWCDGGIGRVGAISVSNSLVGTSANDQIGSASTLILNNGNFIIRSPIWDNGANTDAGAVTWCSGTTGRVGPVSASNSLVGSTASDGIGNRIAELTNGNFVVGSTLWNNGSIANAGAATWCNGSTGRVGTISASNSLVGSTNGDQVGDGIIVLNNGNYIIKSSAWDNGSITNAGAVTWCNGTSGRSGAVSAGNSMVGSSANDNFGGSTITNLPSGNYVVVSQDWDNGVIADAGAVTWCNGTSGRVGAVSASNSLVGSSNFDAVGRGGLKVLTNGSYIIFSLFWKNGTISSAGAISVEFDNIDLFGPINECNSVLGNANNPNPTMNGVFDSAFNYLIVAKPAENKIVIRTFLLGSSFNQTICANQSFLWNGIARNTSGAFKDTFPSFIGCDSVVTLNLTVTPLPSKLTNTTGNTITAAQAGATYQWINCATNTVIAGANAQSFTPSFNGSFKVVITQTNCSDTSTCVPINPVGFASNISTPKAILSPNPAQDYVHVNLSNAAQNATIHFMTLDGKIIQTNHVNQTDNLILFNTLIPGFYLYEIDVDGNIEKGKLLIEE
ncbi:MAG: T9SS type A sorting domain-containing protein [Chitinophagales bacterium]|nr:T9SS type A sorting domain-containing protein [Chitinophagales bacterium]